MKMEPSRLLLLALLASLPLTSCRIVGDRPDFSGVADVFTPVRDDNVVVEGRKAPTAARPAAAPVRVAVAPSAPAARGSYTVRPGDTLSAIARRYGVGLQALLRANELTEASARFVQPGATLTIPSQH